MSEGGNPRCPNCGTDDVSQEYVHDDEEGVWSEWNCDNHNCSVALFEVAWAR